MQRTNTTDTTTFNLPAPEAATFVFPSLPPPSANTIRITITPSSTWHLRYHWHPSKTTNTTITACKYVTCVSGSLHVYIAEGIFNNYNKVVFAGMSVKFVPGQRIL
jgi:hypothetical protein